MIQAQPSLDHWVARFQRGAMDPTRGATDPPRGAMDPPRGAMDPPRDVMDLTRGAKIGQGAKILQWGHSNVFLCNVVRVRCEGAET